MTAKKPAKAKKVVSRKAYEGWTYSADSKYPPVQWCGAFGEILDVSLFKKKTAEND